MRRTKFSLINFNKKEEDGEGEMERERWRGRDGEGEMERERWRRRDGERESWKVLEGNKSAVMEMDDLSRYEYCIRDWLLSRWIF